MYFSGSWVSTELASTIFALWGVAVATLGIVVWCFWRRSPPKGPSSKSSKVRRHIKRKAQRRRQ